MVGKTALNKERYHLNGGPFQTFKERYHLNGGPFQTLVPTLKLPIMSKEINAQKYIKEYESDKVVARHVFPLTLKDYMKDQTECYIKYLSPKDMPYDGYRELRIKPLGENPAETISKRIRYWTWQIQTPYYYLLYQAFQEGDWRAVNDAQYQYAKQQLWHDYNYYDIRNAWLLMAANDFSLLDCNDAYGFSEAFHRVWTAPGNMMMGLYLHDDAAIKRGMAEAEKLLGQKTVGKWYKELSRFMLALVNRDMTEASRSLNTLCENYRYYDQELLSFEKLFCTPAHGLYNFARRVLTGTEFSRLEMPSSPTFFREFALWQRDNNYPAGKQALVYPDHSLRFMNEIINLPPLPSNAPFEALGQNWIKIYGQGIVNLGTNKER